MTRQLDFMDLSPGFVGPDGRDSDYYDRAEDAAIRLADFICDRHTQVRMSKLMRRKPGTLSSALRPQRDQRGGHTLHLRDVIILLLQEGGEDLLALLMSLRDEQVTAEELLQAGDEVLTELLPGVATAFRTKRREVALRRRMQVKLVKRAK